MIEPDTALAAPSARLLGVLTSGTSSSALIAVEDAEAVWVLLGDEVAGWTVSRIEPDLVELKDADRTLPLDLYRK